MNYYRIIAKTPYCGEDTWYYFYTDSHDELMKFASDCVDDNANEWYSEHDDNYPEWEDFLADCYCVIEEIDKFEYYNEVN